MSLTIGHTQQRTKWTPAAPQCTCEDHATNVPVDSFVPSEPSPLDSERRTALGQELWDKYLEGRIGLLPVQVSGRNDGADARSNIADTAMGRQAKRSSYQNAPGGRVDLSFSLLEGMKKLSEEYSFNVTALAGGSHSKRSRHYLGVGIDIDKIDERQVDKNHPKFKEFMAKARALGATEVLGPGSRGHNYHLHIAWPRDATA